MIARWAIYPDALRRADRVTCRLRNEGPKPSPESSAARNLAERFVLWSNGRLNTQLAFPHSFVGYWGVLVVPTLSGLELIYELAC